MIQPLSSRTPSLVPLVHATSGVQAPSNVQKFTTAQLTRFGTSSLETLKDAKGLWITTEFWHPELPDILKKGGLAQVSSTIPWQLKARGMDLRPIFPYYKALQDQGFKKANTHPVIMPSYNGSGDDVYELYYKNIDGVICYAISHPTFNRFNDLYSADKADTNPLIQENSTPTQHSGGMPLQHSGGAPLQQSGGNTGKAINKTLFKFNQAVAAFAPLLDGPASMAREQQPEWRFKGGADVNFYNDWMSGVVLSELKTKHPEYFNKTSSVFFVHNVYDPQTMQFKTAQKLGLSIPEELKTEYVKRAESNGENGGNWFTRWLGSMFGKTTNDAEEFNYDEWGMSPLSYGARFSNIVIMNQRFKETNLDTTFMKDAPFVKFLREKDRQGLAFDMHHAVSDDYDPTKDAILTSEGFTQLKADIKPSSRALFMNGVKSLFNKSLDANALQKQAELEELKRFKAQNKLALQKEHGLKQDPDAVIYGTLARATDMRQKGLFRLVNTIEKFLYEHPHAQFIVGGGFDAKHTDPRVASLVKALTQNPDVADRVSFPGFIDQKGSKHLLAGASSIITPSTYEPYGLTQLEPMKYGATPVVNARDGLFATVYDPYVLPAYNPDPSDRRKSVYGQTGFMMDSPSDNIDYIHRLDSGNWKPTDPEIRKSNEAFYEVMDRSYQAAMTGKGLEIALNGMKYVRNEHTAAKITDLYEPVILKALELKKQRVGLDTKG